MKRILSLAILGLAAASGMLAQAAPDGAELTRLLKEFLAGASRNDPAVHERFWAEELIYTRSAGKRTNKAEILRDLRSAPPAKPGDAQTTYTAEDIRIEQFGTTAIVAFRLVGTTAKEGNRRVTNYLNTGTFLKRDGEWRAVAWQATRMPRPEAETREEVAAAAEAFRRALQEGDSKKLEALAHESFVWTDDAGERVTRSRLLEWIGSGRLRYSKLEARNAAVTVIGETGVARGDWSSQRAAAAGSSGAGDPRPVAASYTLTFAEEDGSWKALALHSSAP